MLLEENKGPLIAFRVATFFHTEVNWRQQIGMILGQSDVTRLTESLSGLQVRVKKLLAALGFLNERGNYWTIFSSETFKVIKLVNLLKQYIGYCNHSFVYDIIFYPSWGLRNYALELPSMLVNWFLDNPPNGNTPDH